MADLYSFQNLGQLSHTNGEIPFILDKQKNCYRTLEADDFGSADAFGRMRVATPFTLFDSSHRYADNDKWSTAIGGTGNATFNANQGLVDLNISTGSGCYVYRETERVFPYQPGKSLLSMSTFTMSPAQTNLVQRIGYFGARDGVFVEQSGSALNLVKRTFTSGSLIEFKVPQSEWNADKLDGNGSSRHNLNTSKSQIFWSDMEWLGAGTIRMGFVIDGKFITAHSFHHANIIEGTYLTTASLPFRYEIFNVGNTSTSGTLKQICSTVISEGGYELIGSQQSIGTPITGARPLTTAGTIYPLVSLKLKSNRLDAIVIPAALSALTIDTSVCEWRLIKGGNTLGGSWTSAGANSSVEYNIDGTGISGGTTLAKGFISSSNQGSSQIDLPKSELLRFQLERNSFTNTATELTLAISASTANELAYGSLDWQEISR